MELLSDGKINSIGAIMSSVTLATIIFMSFLRLIMLLVIFPRSFVSARRINELLQKKMVIAKNGVEKVGKFEELEFKNVCFGYDKSQEYVLEDISFTVKRGETLAILGATGSGKSSILNLIPKFIEPSKGEILINNQNINNLEDNSLLGLIGYVPQKIFLMNQSIKNNVGYGKEITDEELEFFGSLADLNFVNNLENTYDYQVTQSGKNLSGGQKQRVAIARAIAVQPQLLLFDDSFSALDFITDKNIRENIKTNLKEATKIIVAQRIGTVMDADKILVIDKGKIVGSGTHQELIKTCQIYREIALSQLTQEEVENA
jgi:ATP-binding cassette subfamily B protein